MLGAWIVAIITGVVMHFLGFSVDELFLGTLLSFALMLMLHILFLKRTQKY